VDTATAIVIAITATTVIEAIVTTDSQKVQFVVVKSNYWKVHIQMTVVATATMATEYCFQKGR
jgi:hypothetical protein